MLQGFHDDAGVDELTFDRANIVINPAFIVDNGDVIISNVLLLVVAIWIRFQSWHHGGHVENNLHNLILPAVRILSVASIGFQSPQEHVEGVGVGQFNQSAQPLQKLHVSDGTVLVTQDIQL
uniref:Uncharacterized protein n=1 Tax=Cacopsylla melanoneura TaxID=428564 RepID=A0A8D9AXH4_9HEMI